MSAYSTYDVSFDTKLTKKRLPTEMYTADTFRLVVWEIDVVHGEPTRSVFDIIEFDGLNPLIKFFNKNRKTWNTTLNATISNLSDPLPDFEGMIEAYMKTVEQPSTSKIPDNAYQVIIDGKTVSIDELSRDQLIVELRKAMDTIEEFDGAIATIDAVMEKYREGN